MWKTCSRVWGRLFRKKKAQFLMLGLDAAGKTTILYKLKLGEVVTTVPVRGFCAETLEHHDMSFMSWDLGGQPIRAVWRHFTQKTSGLIFVVDSRDRDRVETAHNELAPMLVDENLRGIPLLVFANKSDLPGGMSTAEVADRLGLEGFKDCQWFIQSCSAKTGAGLHEGLNWLVTQDLSVKHHE